MIENTWKISRCCLSLRSSYSMQTRDLARNSSLCCLERTVLPALPSVSLYQNLAPIRLQSLGSVLELCHEEYIRVNNCPPYVTSTETKTVLNFLHSRGIYGGGKEETFAKMDGVRTPPEKNWWSDVSRCFPSMHLRVVVPSSWYSTPIASEFREIGGSKGPLNSQKMIGGM